MRLNAYLATQTRIQTCLEKRAAQPDKPLWSVRELARKFRMPQKDMLDRLEDLEHISVNCGERTHGGIYEYPRIGDYQPEWLGPTRPGEHHDA